MSPILKVFRPRVVCALLLCLSGAPPLSAQGNAATIAGTVADPSRAAIPDATVTAKNLGTDISQTVVSDSQGRFRILQLGLGNYEIRASKMGFSTVVRQGVTLTVGSESVIDFVLPVGQAQETVTVEGQVSQVETSSAAISNLVEPTQMRELPLNGRNFEQLLTLAPGVQQLTAQASNRYGTQGNYSVAGSRGEGMLYLLDTTNIQGFFNHGTGSGATGASLGVEAISEFQTLTNTYSAQFGGGGAVINAVSKSGTNSFHGSAYEFLRNSKLDARSFFDTLRKPGATEADVPAFRRNQFGGSVGGPIKKDKAFIFVNYEGIRQLLGQTQPSVFVPDANAHKGDLPACAVTPSTCNTPAGAALVHVGVNPLIASTLALFPLPPAGTPSTNGIANIGEVASQIVHENYFLSRFDYNFTERDSLFVRYVYDKGTIFGPFAQTPVPGWPEQDYSANHYATIEEKHIISPSLINLARASFVRPQEQGGVFTQTPALQFYGHGPDTVDGRVAVTGLSNLGPGGTIPFEYIPNHFMEADDVLWTKGAHSIRFGISVDRIRYATNNPFQLAGQYSFTSLTNFLQSNSSAFAGPLPGQADGIRDYRELLIAPYIHDEWKISRTVTLNLGVRYDWAANPTEARHGLTTVINPPYSGGFVPVPHIFANNPSTKDFAGRIGIAWDPFKDHKTSIRAGAGNFFDVIMAREYIFGFSLAPPFGLGAKANPTYGPAFAGGGTPNLPALSSGENYQISQTPHMYQYNLTIQRDIGFGSILSVGYVGAAGIHLLNNYEQNPPTPVIDANGVYHFATLSPAGKVVGNPRLNPAVGPLPIKSAVGHSNYNSLQVGLNRRFQNGLQFQVSYTYSRSMDNDSSSNGLESSNSSNTEMNPFNLSQDRAPSDFNRTQSLRVSSVYSLPFHGNKLIDGWQFSGLLTAASGPPFTIITGFDQTGFLQNFAGRPNLVPGCAPNAFEGLATQWFDPKCFSLNAFGTFGNLGRNTGFGPDLWNTDFALLKNTRVPKISDSFNIQFRAEIFDIFNHANFGLPNTTMFTAAANGGGNLNPNAGRITSIATPTPARQIQLALKFIF